MLWHVLGLAVDHGDIAGAPFFFTLEHVFFHPQGSFFPHPMEPFFSTLPKPSIFTLHTVIFTL